MRTLGRTPGFTAMAIATLALGIGATTAIFSVVNKVLLETLPYPEPDRLVQLISSSPLGDQTVVSIQKFDVWRDFVNVFQNIAAYEVGSPAIRLTQSGFPEALSVARVSAGYFTLFGAQVTIG